MHELPDAQTPPFDPPHTPHIGIADAVAEDEELELVELLCVLELCLVEVAFVDKLCNKADFNCVEEIFWPRELWPELTALWLSLAEPGLHCEYPRGHKC